MIDFNMVWIITGIISCLIFTLSYRDTIRDTDLLNGIVLIIVYVALLTAGPIGLTMMLLEKILSSSS
ncbi:hypothetical protein EBR43_06690 [bacterium]|nr:hypothetical protein [bacterium]